MKLTEFGAAKWVRWMMVGPGNDKTPFPYGWKSEDGLWTIRGPIKGLGETWWEMTDTTSGKAYTYSSLADAKRDAEGA